MRSRSRSRSVVLGLVFGCSLALPASRLGASSDRARPVSPGARDAVAPVEARCPNFQWAGVPDAPGYAIAVFRLAEEDGGEPRLVQRVDVAGDARGWTPSGLCLERGARYAWSVAATLPDRDPEWSDPLLFEVEPAPSAGQVDRAVEMLRNRPVPGRPDTAQAPAHPDPLLDPAALTNPTVGARIASAAASPVVGSASLSVTNQVHLGEASAVFKGGELFLWDDGEPYSGNTALGRGALASVDYNVKNTAVGRDALRDALRGAEYTYSFDGSANTAVGYRGLAANTSGSRNTALGAYALAGNQGGFANTGIGYQALQSNQGGDRNTAVGVYALRANIEGVHNTAIGVGTLAANEDGIGNTAIGQGALPNSMSADSNVALGASALGNNVSGSNNTALGTLALLATTSSDGNTAIGHRAGFHTTGHDNVLIQNDGSADSDESHVLRIGQSTAAGDPQFFAPGAIDRAFIHGIFGRTPANGDAVAVVIDSAGQLGTMSSARATKQDIADLDPLDDRLLELHPVSFRYRRQVETDPTAPIQFGLVAEEVAEVFPELVVYDRDGRPQTVKYHLLSTLLLAEVQRLRARLDALESSPPPARFPAGPN